MRADDFMKKRENDPQYQAMRRKKDAEFAELRAELAADQAELVQELRDADVYIVLNNIPGEEYEGSPKSVWDLVNTESRYPEAIPILLKHLDIEHDPRIREGIIRALSTPDARGIATERLIREFKSSSDERYKWIVGLAVGETTTPQTGERVAELALDDSHGMARHWLPLGMLSADPSDAKRYLPQMLDDPVTKENAEKALKRLEKREKSSLE